MGKLTTFGYVWLKGLLVLAIFLGSFFFIRGNAHAADAGEFVFFRIDTELDTLNDKGVTVRFTCGGGNGLITDNTASESTNALDGIVKVSSISKEFTDAGCNFTGTKTVTASASLNGWLMRQWSQAIPASSASPFTTTASMDYTIVVNGVADELGTTLTLNGSTASATYSGTVASQSYSAGKKYIAGSTSGGTVTGGANGYVNRTSSALTISSTASQSVDFDTSITSSINASGLLFGHKFSVFRSGGDSSNDAITTSSVVAGDSSAVTCTRSGSTWYCPVPLSHTGTTATFNATSDYESATVTYTDRSTGSDSQTTNNLTPVKKSNGGGSSGGSSSSSSSATPASTPTPESNPTPTPTWTPSPESTPWPISQSSNKLYRKANDPKVYVVTSDGSLSWVKTLQDFNAAGYKWKDVQMISGSEFGKMKIEGKLKVVKGIGYLNVRDNSSVQGKKIGKILSNEQYDFSANNNGWYKIKKNGSDWGWVSGQFVLEN